MSSFKFELSAKPISHLCCQTEICKLKPIRLSPSQKDILVKESSLAAMNACLISYLQKYCEYLIAWKYKTRLQGVCAQQRAREIKSLFIVRKYNGKTEIHLIYRQQF